MVGLLLFPVLFPPPTGAVRVAEEDGEDGGGAVVPCGPAVGMAEAAKLDGGRGTAEWESCARGELVDGATGTPASGMVGWEVGAGVDGRSGPAPAAKGGR